MKIDIVPDIFSLTVSKDKKSLCIDFTWEMGDLLYWSVFSEYLETLVHICSLNHVLRDIWVLTVMDKSTSWIIQYDALI